MKPFETKPALSDPKKSPGFCVLCGEKATTQALFKLPDAIIVERYCNKCLPKANYIVDKR